MVQKLTDTEAYADESIFPTCSTRKQSWKLKSLEKRQMISFIFAVTIKFTSSSSVSYNMYPYQFWFIADRYPDLVNRLHFQIRLVGSFGLNGGVPWLTSTNGELCLFYKDSVDDVSHFLSDWIGCLSFRDNFEFLWSNLSKKIAYNPSDGTQIPPLHQQFRQRTKSYIAIRRFSSPLWRSYSHHDK